MSATGHVRIGGIFALVFAALLCGFGAVEGGLDLAELGIVLLAIAACARQER